MLSTNKLSAEEQGKLIIDSIFDGNYERSDEAKHHVVGLMKKLLNKANAEDADYFSMIDYIEAIASDPFFKTDKEKMFAALKVQEAVTIAEMEDNPLYKLLAGKK